MAKTKNAPVSDELVTFKSLNLTPEIEKAIDLCGYTIPTPVQAQSIPYILDGRDIVASAQTGTGKTAAFVLPALDLLSKLEPAKKTRILILTPTRELANQITKAAAQYGKFLKFNIVNLVGGMPYHQQIRELSRGADIVVATPGRLLDHIEQKRLSLSSIKMLVLDEADRMLDMGFIDDVEYIAKLTPENRQTLMFSATVDRKLTTVVRHLLKNPARVDLSNEQLTVPNIEQHFYKATSPHHKARLLNHFMKQENIYKAIIFTATKVFADKIADMLCDEGYAAAALHGDLRQNVRNRTIDQLRQGRIQFLVATDVAARGIDISDITHVFNYDLPRSPEDYVHRIGRTGRAGKSGVAIAFVSPADSKHLQHIERYLGERVNLIANLDVGQNPSHPKEGREIREPREHRSDRVERAPREFRGRDSRAPRGEHRSFSRETKHAPREDYSNGDDAVSGNEYRPKVEYGASVRPARKPAARREGGDRGFGSKRGGSEFGKRSSHGDDRPYRSSKSASSRSIDRSGDREDRTASFDRPKSAFRKRDGEGKSFDSDRPRSSERSSFGDRLRSSDRPNFGDRPKPAFKKRGGDDRSFGSDRRSSFGDRPKPAFRKRDGEDRPARSDRSDRPRSSERPSFGDRPKSSFRKSEGEGRSFSDRKPAFKKRGDDRAPSRSASSDRKPAFKKRDSDSADKPFRAKRAAPGGDRPLRRKSKED